MSWFASSLVLVFVLTGCAKANNDTTPPPADPIDRFVARYPNIQGSIVWSHLGGPTSMSAEQAVAQLKTNGVRMPMITNLTVLEIRPLHPDDSDLARRLTNCVAALVDSEIGQKIIVLRPSFGEREWSYHVFQPQ